MRCLILSSEFPPGPGGLGTHAFEVSRNLARRGWDVRVLTSQDNATAEEIAEFNAGQPMRISTLPRVPGGVVATLMARWRVAATAIESERPDILMATGDRANYTMALLARRFRLPWVAIEHGRYPPAWELPLKKWAYRAADTLVCVSNYTLGETKKMGVRPRAVQVIPNGADPDRFGLLPESTSFALRESLGLQGERILVTVGSVTERKGQDVVIRALPRILERVPNTHYLCAGRPIMAEAFGNLARQLGVDERIRFLGAVNNDTVVALLNAADVFLMTSRTTRDQFEGYGIAAVEAALCGKPTVVTSDSGLGEAIVHGETGFAIPQNDTEAIADSVIRLLTDEPLRLRMGEAGRRQALEEQTWARRVDEYDCLFRSLVESRRTPA